MEKTLVTELRNEHQRITEQIKLLMNKDESICNLLNQYEDLEETIAESTAVKKKVKATKQKQPKAKASKNISKSGLMKFSQALKNIFVSKPDIPYTSKDLVKIMTKEIEAGRCNPSKKDMTSAVSAYIWNFSQRGLLKKLGDGYLWTDNGKALKKQEPIFIPDDLDVLDEAIIEILKRTADITEGAIVHDVRISSSYGDIAKNLNGSLASEINKRLHEFGKRDFVKYNDGKLSLNPKAEL